MDRKTTIVSFGGGVNSTALLVGLVERNEPPFAVLFADTGGEKPETYEHVAYVDAWLKSKGFPSVTTVRQKLTLEDDCLDRETLPGKAFGFGSCSDRFKVQPQKRWLRENNVKDAMWLVGIHVGEKHRAERTLNQRPDVRFPLIEWNWGQQECVDAIQRIGLKVPCKSACFFCPAVPKRDVIKLAKEHPELFQRAVEMEQAAREGGRLTTIKGLGRHWSWEAVAKADESQLRLFDDDQPPMCEVCVDW